MDSFVLIGCVPSPSFGEKDGLNSQIPSNSPVTLPFSSLGELEGSGPVGIQKKPLPVPGQ